MQQSSDFAKLLAENTNNLQTAIDRIIAERDMAIKAANAVLTTRASKYVFKSRISQEDLDADIANLMFDGGIKFSTGKHQRMHTLKFDGVVINFSEIDDFIHNITYKNRIEIFSQRSNDHIYVRTTTDRMDDKINRNQSINPETPMRLSDKYDFVVHHESSYGFNNCAPLNVYMRVVNRETDTNIIEVNIIRDNTWPHYVKCNTFITIGDQKIKYANDRMILE